MSQENQIERIKKALELEATSNNNKKNIHSHFKGCCIIELGGGKAKRDGLAESQCIKVKNQFPGASYRFYPNVSCDETD